MAHFAITLDDGSLALMQTVGGATPAECIGKWPRALRTRVIDAVAIDPGLIPADRTFRNAWTLASGAIATNMAKARDLKRDQLRAERVPRLADLDEAYLRADEIKDDVAKAAIAAEKQKLRAVTDDPSIEAAATPEALKAITLDQLTAKAVSADPSGSEPTDPQTTGADPVAVGG